MLIIEIAQQARVRSNHKQFSYSKLTDESPGSVADTCKASQAERSAAGTNEARDKTSSAEAVLIDLVAPVGVMSSVLPVSSSDSRQTNSIMDEPIDAVEQGKLIVYFSLFGLTGVYAMCPCLILCLQVSSTVVFPYRSIIRRLLPATFESATFMWLCIVLIYFCSPFFLTVLGMSTRKGNSILFYFMVFLYV